MFNVALNNVGTPLLVQSDDFISRSTEAVFGTAQSEVDE
jgi:hypothetical protein